MNVSGMDPGASITQVICLNGIDYSVSRGKAGRQSNAVDFRTSRDFNVAGVSNSPGAGGLSNRHAKNLRQP